MGPLSHEAAVAGIKVVAASFQLTLSPPAPPGPGARSSGKRHFCTRARTLFSALEFFPVSARTSLSPVPDSAVQPAASLGCKVNNREKGFSCDRASCSPAGRSFVVSCLGPSLCQAPRRVEETLQMGSHLWRTGHRIQPILSNRGCYEASVRNPPSHRRWGSDGRKTRLHPDTNT